MIILSESIRNSVMWITCVVWSLFSSQYNYLIDNKAFCSALSRNWYLSCMITCGYNLFKLCY
jgi:hypothetical protein